MAGLRKTRKGIEGNLPQPLDQVLHNYGSRMIMAARDGRNNQRSYSWTSAVQCKAHDTRAWVFGTDAYGALKSEMLTLRSRVAFFSSTAGLLRRHVAFPGLLLFQSFFKRMRRSMVTRSLSVSSITFMAGPTPEQGLRHCKRRGEGGTNQLYDSVFCHFIM